MSVDPGKESVMNEYESVTRKLCDFIAGAPSCYHAITQGTLLLEKAGFQRLSEQEHWELVPGKSYYVIRSGSSMIAFHIPVRSPHHFQIVASHSDSPSFRIKEDPEIRKADHYVTLNIESYGGMLKAPWFDRPLGVAGRLMVCEGDTIRQVLADSGEDLLMIPSLAIHMDRKANESAHSSVQSEMLPVFGDENSFGSFLRLMAEKSGVRVESIVGYDLFLYNRTPYSIWGAGREFFSSPRLDDLQCAYASLRALAHSAAENSPDADSISVCCLFDNEEVGSRTKQGADSTFLQDVLKRISSSFEWDPEKLPIMLSSSFMLSADNSHAVHPNYPDKADPVNRPFMNGGVVLKYNANQKYTTDAVSASVFRSICRNADIPVQTYFNHSDIPGGSTLGNISSSHVSINCADIGCAQLAMHSPYETAGIKDTAYMISAMEAFYDASVCFLPDGSVTVR